jgi:hypothetical protein
MKNKDSKTEKPCNIDIVSGSSFRKDSYTLAEVKQMKTMKAKEFILSESKAFRDAVDNGYDIRMDEKEILYWMERYAEYKAENSPISDVVNRRELLKAFCLHGGIQVLVPSKAQDLDELIEDFIESL